MGYLRVYPVYEPADELRYRTSTAGNFDYAYLSGPLDVVRYK